jgi:hypothetical protein
MARAASLVVAPEWNAWIAENVARGVDKKRLVADLVTSGVSRALAKRTVEAIAASPLIPAFAATQRRMRAVELQLRLRKELHGDAPIERRTMPRAAELFERYWEGSRPFVATNATRGWGSLAPRDLARLAGDVEVEVTDGRTKDPRYDENTATHSKKTTLRAFVDRVLRARSPTNDFYMVANNKTLQRAALRPVVDRISVDPEIFDLDRLQGGASLWLGPAGTVTPLHHDTTNIFFCQTHGEKDVILIPPWETSLLETARGFYNDANPEKLPSVTKTVVRLHAGEGLFIPVGWWHHVRSRSTSVSVSLVAFRRPNDFAWYAPGAAS